MIEKIYYKKNLMTAMIGRILISSCCLLSALIFSAVVVYGAIETCCDLSQKLSELKSNECATITKSGQDNFYQIIIETGPVPIYPCERLHSDYVAEFVSSCLDDYPFVMVIREGSTNYFYVFYPEESTGLGSTLPLYPGFEGNSTRPLEGRRHHESIITSLCFYLNK